MMITCSHLSKMYGRFAALSDLDLSIREGEIYGLIGPNGAGKTTTIKLIVGLLQPTSGYVEIGGINMADNPLAAKQNLGYIPDEPFLYERLSPSELMDFKGSLFNMTRKEIDARKDGLFDLVAMNEYRDDLIESFSLGMKQRIAIATALLPSPKVIIVDEPLVGLDPKGMKRVKEIFKDLAAEGRTVFISTHMLNVVEELATTVGVLDRGRLIAQGTVDELTRSQDQKLETVFFRLFS